MALIIAIAVRFKRNDPRRFSSDSEADGPCPSRSPGLTAQAHRAGQRARDTASCLPHSLLGFGTLINELKDRFDKIDSDDFGDCAAEVGPISQKAEP